MAAATATAADFVALTTEKRTLNQYWYSVATIELLAAEAADVLCNGGTVACLSTPSVFFALRAQQQMTAMESGGRMYLLDVDEQWADIAGPDWVRFDYREPLVLPELLVGSFDMCIIDPPFVTEDVWRCYGAAAKALLRPPSQERPPPKVLLTTVAENGLLLAELFGVRPEGETYLPSIPNLVYQYRIFVNYDSPRLKQLNEEIPT